MRQSIKVADRTVSVGDRLCATANAPERGVCPEGHIVTVIRISDEGQVALKSDRRLSGWGNLDGLTPPRQGLWVSRDCVHDNFVPMNVEFVIKGKHTHRKRDLQGMKCKLLRSLPDGRHAFVELEENIGGGSADGLGKGGHCVLVPKNVLATAPKPKKVKAKKKAKAKKKKEG